MVLAQSQECVKLTWVLHLEVVHHGQGLHGVVDGLPFQQPRRAALTWPPAYSHKQTVQFTETSTRTHFLWHQRALAYTNTSEWTFLSHTLPHRPPSERLLNSCKVIQMQGNTNASSFTKGACIMKQDGKVSWITVHSKTKPEPSQVWNIVVAKSKSPSSSGFYSCCGYPANSLIPLCDTGFESWGEKGKKILRLAWCTYSSL